MIYEIEDDMIYEDTDRASEVEDSINSGNSDVQLCTCTGVGSL